MRLTLPTNCIVTGNKHYKVAVTREGPMWIGLWHNQPINFDPEGWALIPNWMTPFLEIILGRAINEKALDVDDTSR